ncbi:SusE domain-containing protein [Arcticibacter sp.]|uniref:SusE domain-containing protein n=1 Tax=Arcticibacter sp. TaxID=1872630 RepID=UPI00388DD239
MKKIFNNIGIIALTILVLASCKKEEEKLTINTGESPVLAASSNVLTLSEETAADTVISFSWNKYEVAWSQPQSAIDVVEYTLEMDAAGQNFASPYQVDMTGRTLGKYNGADFNALLVNRLELPVNVESTLEVRLKTMVSDNSMPVYSNVVSMKVTPYLLSTVPDYPSLYVVGSHQGWSPETAPAIRSAKNDGMYEGFVNFPTASTEFKLTTARNWTEPAYGDGGPGLLSLTGGNVKQEGAGYYLIKFNKETLAWSAVKTTWALIGNATPGGWEADTPLTYDEQAQVWKTTVTLTGGDDKEFKFRANGEWLIDLGAGSSEGVLSFGGKNFKLAESGTYDVTLDLSNGAYYMYTLRKK